MHNYKIIAHSAKGSQWKDHMYIKVEKGKYYYPDSYKGGRHLPKGESSGNGSQTSINMKEYSENDPDFNDSNYSESNRLGNTDFFGFRRKDGTFVILEEDMKWELPNTSRSEALIKKLEEFDNQVRQLRDEGYTAADWQKWATEIMNGKTPDYSTGKKNGKKVTDGQSTKEGKTSEALKKIDESSNKELDETKEIGISYRKKPNGTYTIYDEEGNSWNLPKGIDPSTSNIQKLLEDNINEWEKDENRNYYGYDAAVKDAIKKASSKKSSKEVTHSSVIMHHGILGQKWGVRRYQNADGSLTQAGRKRYSKDLSDLSDDDLRAKVNRMNLEKQYRELSNNDDYELRQTVNRMNLEKQYRDLTPKPQTPQQRAKDFAKGVAGTLGTTAAIIGSAVAVYNNYEKAQAIVNKMKNQVVS